MPRATVIPTLGYPDVIEAANWLCDAFGFTVRLRIADHRIQMNVGEDGAIVVTELRAGAKVDHAHAMMIRVTGIDDHYEQAKAAGATIVQPPATQVYGERQYTAEDPAGHRWTFSETVADVTPESWGGTSVEL